MENRDMTRLSGVSLAMLVAAQMFAMPALAQRQVVRVTASNVAQGDNFGWATAIDGDWAIIGAPLNDNRAFQGGAAYVFQRVNGVWTQTQELLASDGGSPDQFGCAIAMSGDQAVVGAFDNDTPAASQSGAAYVFQRVGTTWVESAKLVASDASFTAQFGKAVAISGDRIVVGAWNAGSTGRAYVFERFGASWLQVANLTGNDSAPGDSLGTAVAIDGDLVVVGSPWSKINPPFSQGAAYVFSRNALGVWAQQQKLIASDGAHQDLFGLFVGISGSISSVTAPSHNSDRGAQYFYDYNGSTWNQVQEFTVLDATSPNSLGITAFAGDTAIMITNQDADLGPYSGAAYVAKRLGPTWVQIGKCLANDGIHNDQMFVASFSGTTVLIGAPGCDDVCVQNTNCESGAAYFFELAPTAIQYGSCPTGSPCTNADSHGGCRNSTGQGAILQASGSGSCTTDDLVLEVRHLPPFAPGLIFMGGTQAGTPFGSGRLVVGDSGTGIYRIEIHFSDADGAFLHGPGTVALTQGIPNPLGHITAGQTWDFQCWYRDQQGPCGFGFNLTNGLQVSFVP